MKGHCSCDATGASSHAIARRFQSCLSGGNAHPWDPADLRRCMDYCAELHITTERLQARMAGVSPEWDALLPEWDRLVAMLREEMADRKSRGMAKKTYAAMRSLLDPMRVKP